MGSNLGDFLSFLVALGSDLGNFLSFLRKQESRVLFSTRWYSMGSDLGNFLSFLRKQESRPIWIRVFYISGFPFQREQAWIPSFSGMTFFLIQQESRIMFVIPVKAGIQSAV